MHLLADHATASTRSPSRSISARRRPTSWCCPSPTATSPGLRPPGRRSAALLPSVRLAQLRDLRHPMSVDLWIDRVGQPRQGHPGAPPRRLRLVALRLRPADARWRASAASRWRCCPARTATTDGWPRPRRCRRTSSTRCWAISARAAATTCARCCAGSPAMPARDSTAPSRGRCRASAPIRRRLAQSISTVWSRDCAPGAPVVPILFYRSMLLAADVAPIDALCAALRRARHRAGADLRLEPQGPGRRSPFVERRCARLSPAAIVTATAFASGAEPGEPDAVRPPRRAGASRPSSPPPGARPGRQPARPWRRRPRHACRAARARRPHPCRRDRLQGPMRATDDGACLHGASPTGRSRTASSRWRSASPRWSRLQADAARASAASRS